MAELLVVLSIILVVSLTAVTGYANLRRSRSVREGAEAIQAVLVSARAYAITTNGHYRVVLQLRDSSNAEARPTFWIDEIYRNTNTDPSPSAGDITRDVKAGKITTPERLPEGVDVADVTVTQFRDTGTQERVTPANSEYVIVRFFPDGSSDQSSIRLVREGAGTADNNPRSYAINLSAPTAKPKIVSAELR